MGGGFSTIFILIMFAGLMFFMTRSQKKQQQERQKVLNAMKPGDNVVTIGGLHGVISELNEKTVFIDCEGVILEFDRSAIRTATAGTAVADQTEATSETKIETEETQPSEEPAPHEHPSDEHKE